MKLVTAYFDWRRKDAYRRLCKVLIQSANNLGLDIDVLLLPIPEFDKEKHRDKSFVANTIKLEYWRKYLEEQYEGEEIIFLDSDMMIFHDPSDAFEQVTDFGYTLKSKKGVLNGGAIFAVNSQQTRDFFKLWEETNLQMLYDEKFHKIYLSRYWGINQASLGRLLELNLDYIDPTPLPCRKYNACDDDWMTPNITDSSIIHVKGNLRKQALFGGVKKMSNANRFNRFLSLAKKWREFEEEAMNLNIFNYIYNLKDTEQWESKKELSLES